MKTVTYLLSLLLVSLSFGLDIRSKGYGINREAAVNSALRNAVSQGVGMELGSSTLTENFMVVSDKILTKTKGYVSKYTILSEKEVVGSYEVEVLAEVSKSKINDDLAAINLLQKFKNQPKVMVLLDERAEGQPMFEKTATHKLEEYLLSQNYTLVEQEQLEELRKQEMGRKRSPEELAKIGFRFGADLIIRGKVSAGKATERKVYGTTMHNVPIQFNARIVRTDNAQILASTTKRVKKNSRDAFSAAQFGLEVGGEALGKALSKKLVAFWKNEIYNSRFVQLEIEDSKDGLSDEQVSSLRQLAFIKDANIRFFKRNYHEYNVEMTGNIHQMKAFFEKINGLSVIGMTPNRIIVAGKDKPAKIDFEPKSKSVEFTEFTIDEIFPSRVQFYSQNSLATIKFKVNLPSINRVKVSIFIPELMKVPSEMLVNKITSDTENQVKAKLVFDSKKLAKWKSTQEVQAQVKITAGGYKESLNSPVRVHHVNALDWQDLESYASFIHDNHPSIYKVSRQLSKKMNQSSSLLKTVDQSMAAFQLMESMGISYTKDPSGISPGGRIIDRVQYPWETLSNKTGDCDDLTVLYASLLSSLGVQMAIVTYPDHVLSMVNTGIYAKNAYRVSIDPSKYVIYQGQVWLPIETTMMGKGFLKAWEAASSEYHEARKMGTDLQITLLDEAWKKYPAAGWKAKVKTKFPSSFLKSWKSEQTKFSQQNESNIKGKIKSLTRKTDMKSQTQLGVLYAQLGDYPKSLATLKPLKSKSAQAQNNYAVSLILNGDEKTAISELKTIESKLPEAKVNLALSYYLSANSGKGQAQFLDKIESLFKTLPPGKALDQLGEFLGLDLGMSDGTRAAEDHSKVAPKKINRRTLREMIRKRLANKKKGGKSIVTSIPFGGVRGADPDQVEEVSNLLVFAH